MYHEKPKFECLVKDCHERFTKRKDLRNHLIYTHHEYDATHICPEPNCGIKFPSLKALSAHEKQHGEYICSICNQKFIVEKYLKKHLQIHNENRSKFPCDQCEKQFLYKTNLAVHKKSKHQKVSFKCVFCDRSLSTKQKLRQHITLLHENENYSIFIDTDDYETEEHNTKIDENNKLRDKPNENSNGFSPATTMDSVSPVYEGSTADDSEIGEEYKITIDENNKLRDKPNENSNDFSPATTMDSVSPVYEGFTADDLEILDQLEFDELEINN